VQEWLTNPSRSKVTDGIAKSHNIIPASPAVSPTNEKASSSGADGSREKGWAEWTPTRIRQRRASIPPMLGSAEDESESESEDSGEDGERARQNAHALDRELAIMRRVFHKWCRRAGVNGKTCDELPQGEGEVSWTRAIAPRVEGRIRMVTVGAK
jgi:hypothetical protein